MATITNRFVHLTYSQAASTTVFEDATQSNYYKLDGQTADEAELVAYSGSTTDYTIIPSNAVVFVEFNDGTTGIITHTKFYSKLSDLNNSGTGIKVLSSDQYGEGLPTESYDDLGVQYWDVVAFYNNYSSAVNWFDIAVCTEVSTYTDGSGETVYRYMWTPVYHWPTVPLADWANAQSDMTAGN